MDHHEKLAWSAQHLHALHLEIQQWVKENRFTARGEQRGDTREFDIVVDEAAPLLPPHWPLMAGDAIHNMRSALDHIVSALTARHPTQPNVDERRKVGFPVYTDKPAYWGKGKGDIGGRGRMVSWVGAEALTIIDGCQPYHRGKDAHDHPLAVLAAYSNEDKHRNLVASAALPADVRFGFRFIGRGRQMVLTDHTITSSADGGRLYKNAKVAVLEFSEGTTCRPGEMEVWSEFSPRIAFGIRGSTATLRVSMLEELLNRIHIDVVAPLDAILVR